MGSDLYFSTIFWIRFLYLKMQKNYWQEQFMWIWTKFVDIEIDEALRKPNWFDPSVLAEDSAKESLAKTHILCQRLLHPRVHFAKVEGWLGEHFLGSKAHMAEVPSKVHIFFNRIPEATRSHIGITSYLPCTNQIKLSLKSNSSVGMKID